MATLGDGGSTDVNLNNPYNVALANKQAQTTPTYPMSQLNQSLMGPKSVQYEKEITAPGKPSPLVGTGLVTSGASDQPPVSDDSTADTPEARPGDQKKQQSAADLQQINHTLSPKTAAAPKLPTEQQNVNAALAPDQAILAGLPDEYKSALASLAPYINSGQDTGNAALDAADKQVGDIASNTGPIDKALGGLAKAGKEFEGTVPYQGIIQALLGQSKYDITYNNAQPGNKADWNSTMNDIYEYLSGANASSDGLPTPTSAAATAPGSPSTNTGTAGGGNA